MNDGAQLIMLEHGCFKHFRLVGQIDRQSEVAVLLFHHLFGKDVGQFQKFNFYLWVLGFERGEDGIEMTLENTMAAGDAEMIIFLTGDVFQPVLHRVDLAKQDRDFTEQRLAEGRQPQFSLITIENFSIKFPGQNAHGLA